MFVKRREKDIDAAADGEDVIPRDDEDIPELLGVNEPSAEIEKLVVHSQTKDTRTTARDGRRRMKRHLNPMENMWSIVKRRIREPLSTTADGDGEG